MTHLRPAMTVACPHCGASNRVDPVKEKRGLRPSCGRCHAALEPASQVIEVSDARFDDEVLTSQLPVLLDVWAAWCMPCRGMEPIIKEMASSLAGRVRVAKLDIDRNPETAARLRIQGVPTLVLFRGGREITRMIGARGRDEILHALAGVA